MNKLARLEQLLDDEFKGKIKVNAEVIISGTQGPFMKYSGYFNITYNQGYNINLGNIGNMKIIGKIKYKNSILIIPLNLEKSYLEIKTIKELNY